MTQIRTAANRASQQMSCQVPETMLTELSDSIRQQAEGDTPGEANAAPVVMQSNWGVHYRWIAHARIERTLRSADPSRVVQGTTTTSSEVRRGSSASEERRDESTSGGSLGLSGGPTSDHGSATAEARREGSHTHGTTASTSHDGGRTDTTQVSATGPVAQTQQHYDYTVSWDLRVEQDNQGDWGLQTMLSMVFTEPFHDSGIVSIGSRTMTSQAPSSPSGGGHGGHHGH